LGAGGIEAQKTVVRDAISNIPHTTSFSNLLSNIYLPQNTSHTLFELSCTNPQRLFTTATYNAASTWVLDELLLAYEARMADAAWEFYNVAEGTRDGASLLGRIWERQVHNFIHSRMTPYTVTLISLEDQPTVTPVESTWEIPVGVPRCNFDFQSFLGFLDAAIAEKTPSYLVPLDPNFPTIDSAFYKPDEPFRGLQVTKRLRHPAKTAGLKQIQKWMKRKSLASHIRPSESKPWDLIFVVPNGTELAFSKQPLIGSEVDIKVWAKKIKQFVMGLPKDVVLKTPSPQRIDRAVAEGN
jgi:hypothetical protein